VDPRPQQPGGDGSRRFTKPTFDGCDVEVEGPVAEPVRAALQRLGHWLAVRGDFSSNTGGRQVVMRDYKAGVNYGASHPRKDGAAIPQLWVGASYPPNCDGSGSVAHELVGRRRLHAEGGRAPLASAFSTYAGEGARHHVYLRR
jgi:hypothetical protein